MKLKIIKAKKLIRDTPNKTFFHINVAKKTAKKSVTRNNIKRRMREIIRANFKPNSNQKEYVFYSFSIEDLNKSFQDLKMNVLNLIKNYK